MGRAAREDWDLSWDLPLSDGAPRAPPTRMSPESVRWWRAALLDDRSPRGRRIGRPVKKLLERRLEGSAGGGEAMDSGCTDDHAAAREEGISKHFMALRFVFEADMRALSYAE